MLPEDSARADHSSSKKNEPYVTFALVPPFGVMTEAMEAASRAIPHTERPPRYPSFDGEKGGESQRDRVPLQVSHFPQRHTASSSQS